MKLYLLVENIQTVVLVPSPFVLIAVETRDHPEVSCERSASTAALFVAYALRDSTDTVEDGTLVPQECLLSCRPIQSPHLQGTPGDQQQHPQPLHPGAALHPSWWSPWVSRCPQVGPASQSRLTQPASICRGTLGPRVPSLCPEDAVHIVFVKDFRVHSCRSHNPQQRDPPGSPSEGCSHSC